MKLQYKIGDNDWQDFTASNTSQGWYTGSGWTGRIRNCTSAVSTSTAIGNQRHVKFRFIANLDNIERTDSFCFGHITIKSEDGHNSFASTDKDGDGLPDSVESTNVAEGKPVTMRVLLLEHSTQVCMLQMKLYMLKGSLICYPTCHIPLATPTKTGYK